MKSADERTMAEAARVLLSQKAMPPSLLSRVMAIGAGLVRTGRLPQAVVEEKPGHYALCLIQQKDEEVRELAGCGQLVVGRHPVSSDASWQVDDKWLSKQHFRITVDENGFATLEDLGSKNGVCVNDTPLDSPRLLSRGDCIAAGHSLFLLL